MRLGIDLGGTKIEIVALADDGAQLLRRRVQTRRGDYPGTLSVVQGLVNDAEDQLGQRGSIGMGIPGAESRITGLIKNANSGRSSLVVVTRRAGIRKIPGNARPY